MNLSSALSPEVYFKNKAYFDSSLIKLLEKQQITITTLQKKAGIRDGAIYKKNAIITTLKVKNKDLGVINYNLKQHLKQSKKDADKIIKDMDKEIKNINKRIDGELQKSYRENEELYDDNQRLKEELERLRREIDKYKKIAKQDSTNSSLPPSMDIAKKPVRLKEATTKKKGGQSGHKVHRSKVNKQPDKIIEKKVKKAPAGAEAVFNDKKEIEYYVTQEIDGKFVTRITETRYYIEKSGVELPKEIMRKNKINSVTYSSSFKSQVLYLNSKGTIALNRLCLMLNELSKGKIKLQPSTITTWSKEFYEKSTNYRENIVEEAMKAKVVHVDESGWRINGKRGWAHVIATKEVAYFKVTEKRADKETGPLKILEEYRGCVIHDHFKSYYRLENCRHGSCNVHILRYLQSGIDFDESIGCIKLKKLLIEMNDYKKELQKRGIYKIEVLKFKEYERRYLEIIEETLKKYYSENPNVARKYVPDYIKTMERLKVYKEDHLRFMVDFNIPFSNNRAEQQIRSIKTKKKVSGQSDSITTANYYAAIQTVNQTCTLQNLNTLQTIEDILNLERKPSFFTSLYFYLGE